MNILVATDAWEPQVNGVVRTLKSLANAVRKFDAAITFLTPDGFPSVAVPTYPGLRCALPSPREVAQRIERVAPDAIHIATEGPIGAVARHYCVKRGLPFTTSYTTRFPEYISARLPVPESWIWRMLSKSVFSTSGISKTCWATWSKWTRSWASAMTVSAALPCVAWSLAVVWMKWPIASCATTMRCWPANFRQRT